MNDAVDAVRAAVDALVAVGVAAGETEASVLAEAGALAAAATEKVPGAAADWAAAFGGRASGFEAAALAGAPFARRPTPVLARLVSRNDAQAGNYAQALTELASAACSLGEPSLTAMGAASLIAAVQLAAVPPGALPDRATPSGVTRRGSCTIANCRCRGACHRIRAAARGASGEDPR